MILRFSALKNTSRRLCAKLTLFAQLPWVSQNQYQTISKLMKDEENHIALQKLKRNKPITPADIQELERIFFESGDFGTKEDFENAYGKTENLGLFIRSLVGLDREEAKRAFNDFLNGQRYNSNQMEFVNMIIDYLTKNGVMDAAMLYQAPYTNYNSNGLSGIFPDNDATKIVEILTEIRLNAAA